MLNELLEGALKDKVRVVGVVTDDVSSNLIYADRRVWQYPHNEYERVMVKELAEEHGIECLKGRVNDQAFYEIIENQWRPDICVMATFGQRIGKRLIDIPKMGFFNLHPCIDDAWPSQYVGGNPFDALINDGKRYTCVALHSIDEGYDTGPFIARSAKIALPKVTSVTDMHKITAVSAASLAAEHIAKVISTSQVLGVA